MKKAICIILTVIMICSVCVFAAACNDKKSEITTINVVVPDGAPALAVAKMLSAGKFEGYDVKYEIVDGTDIATKLSAQPTLADLAILPTNMGAKLYNSGIGIKMVATNVYGLLYLVGTEEAASVSALKGQKILCTGQGGTPDFVLQYVLKMNGITTEDVEIEYIAKGSDAIAKLKSGAAKFALLGEPAATMAVSKAGAKVLFDMQSEWEKSTGTYGYPQACTVVTNDLFSKHSAFVKAFLKEMNANLTWINENVDATNAAIKANGGSANFASAEVISRCNVKYVGATEAKADVEKYLEIMATFNNKFIGGKLPDAGFYAGVSLD